MTFDLSIPAQLSAALGPDLAPRVLRTGRIDDTSRAWLLRHATVVAYPSLDEGFGFPLLDAMQVGVPLVASSAGSIPEIAGDAAHYCDALAPLGLAGGEPWFQLIAESVSPPRQKRTIALHPGSGSPRKNWPLTL